ncbi:MAG: ABC transporter ATP-binding protein [Nibricoccus sp.]
MPIISVENLGKRYTLRHQARSGLLRDRLASLLRNPFRQLREARATAEDFWALRDVGFSVNQGDVLGIIGRNGAGKSTLLKILSRITEPTTGRISIQGRVASLLEVGTGFHGELSGRENIFLNGAILGMSRAEIRKKFDEIVAFAEVEKFLDTPVKHYSSGMYVRLAFAVAAHLEPEILIVDEVLAVGDADFQAKCMGKMRSVASSDGRTVLFVSHNLSSVRQLCNRAIFLNQGALVFAGDPSASIAAYLSSNKGLTTTPAKQNLGSNLELLSFAVKSEHLPAFADLEITMELRAKSPVAIHELCLLFTNSGGQRTALVDLRTGKGNYRLIQNQTLSLRTIVQRPGFLPGTYGVGFFIRSDLHMQDHLALQNIEVLPQISQNSWASYGLEYLGMVALDSRVSADLSP